MFSSSSSLSCHTSGVESNFDKVSSAFVTTQGVPYDFQSLMHYGPYSFTRNGRPTIEPRDPSVSLSSLGQRNGFSQRDLTHVNVLYCETGRFEEVGVRWV